MSNRYEAEAFGSNKFWVADHGDNDKRTYFNSFDRAIASAEKLNRLEDPHPADAPVLADLKAEQLLEAAKEAQTTYWNLLRDLENAATVTLDDDSHLAGCSTITELQEQYGNVEEEDEDENDALMPVIETPLRRFKFRIVAEGVIEAATKEEAQTALENEYTSYDLLERALTTNAELI